MPIRTHPGQDPEELARSRAHDGAYVESRSLRGNLVAASVGQDFPWELCSVFSPNPGVVKVFWLGVHRLGDESNPSPDGDLSFLPKGVR